MNFEKVVSNYRSSYIPVIPKPVSNYDSSTKLFDNCIERYTIRTQTTAVVTTKSYKSMLNSCVT
jgi:hypothetical protein